MVVGCLRLRPYSIEILSSTGWLHDGPSMPRGFYRLCVERVAEIPSWMIPRVRFALSLVHALLCDQTKITST